jgi:hypothetical protein
VIFDGSRAESMPDHKFLSPTGYWSRFLTTKLERENALFKTFSFEVSENIKLPKGNYVVFFFEVKMEGVKTEIELLGLPVEIASKAVKEIDFNSLPRVLADAKSACSDLEIPQLDISDLLDVARDYLDNILEEKRTTASDDNRYRVESRIAALKRASEIKRRKLQQQIDNHIASRNAERKQPDDNYIRLTRARMEKENQRLNTRTDELQRRQVLTLDHSLDAVAYIGVRGD